MPMTRTWYIAIPNICLHITLFNISSFFLMGFNFNTDTWGGSVARAKAARASMIRFNHSNYGVFNGDLPSVDVPSNTIAKHASDAVI